MPLLQVATNSFSGALSVPSGCIALSTQSQFWVCGRKVSGNQLRISHTQCLTTLRVTLKEPERDEEILECLSIQSRGSEIRALAPLSMWTAGRLRPVYEVYPRYSYRPTTTLRKATCTEKNEGLEPCLIWFIVPYHGTYYPSTG